MISNMKSHLDKSAHKYITYPKFVLLCGKAYDPKDFAESNRGIITRYFQSKAKNVHIVLSESLWEEGFNSNIDLLTFEEFLAEISDLIILFVESPGSFCELGAFAYADKLFSDKLVIVIDEQRKGEKSFIITGPTAKAEKDGSRVIYASYSALLSSSEIREVIEKKTNEFASKSSLTNKRKINKDENKILISTFILEILEIIKLAQPVDRKDLLELYKAVKGFSSFTFVKKNEEQFHNEIKFEYIIKLLTTVRLIELKDNTITFSNQTDIQPFMFEYSKRAENKERNRMLCRKYRYKGL